MSPAPTPDAEVLAEPLRSRWSPSVFDPDHVLDPDDVTTLLQAARWSPSFGNSQPWHLVVLPRGGEGHTALLPLLSRGNAGWVPAASLVVLAGTRVALAPDAADDAKPVGELEAGYARYDLGQAVAHLTLQARAMGLHAHQFAGFDHAAAAAALAVPEHVALMTGVAIGIPGDPDAVEEGTAARDRRERVRRPLGEIASLDLWGRPWTT